MSSSSAERTDIPIDPLAAKLLDAGLTEYERVEVLKRLQNDEEACDRLVEYIMLHAALRHEIGSYRPATLSESLFKQSPAAVPAPLPVAAAENHPLVDSSRSPQTPGFFTASVLGWTLFSVILVIVAASVWWTWTLSKPANESPQFAPSAVALGGRSANNPITHGPEKTIDDSSGGSSPTVASAFVARIVKTSTNCAWDTSAAHGEFLLRCRADEQIRVAAGLVELEFYSGARVILHGPAVFTPIGPAIGHLQSGRLTGEVSEGNFRLITPAAEVIDLGTAFGVVADDRVGTDVVVFNGKVQVVPRQDAKGSQRVLDMTEGMTARVRSDGTVQYGVETEAGRLARFVPAGNGTAPQGEVSLVDVLGGGDGFGSCMAGAIDPTTGLKDRGSEEPGLREGNGHYHPVDWHPLIDGVFVPPARGGAVQIASLGTTAVLPRTRNFTWGPLWARRWETVLENAEEVNDFWGTGTLKHILARLRNARLGIVGMHANVGMTIDLRAVQLLHRSAGTQFRGTVSNIENSEERGESGEEYPERIVDFSVFVDGRLRFARTGLRRKDGDADVVVKLEPGDRFLTIISSDGNSSDSNRDVNFDHLVLIDPVIRLGSGQ